MYLFIDDVVCKLSMLTSETIIEINAATSDQMHLQTKNADTIKNPKNIAIPPAMSLFMGLSAGPVTPNICNIMINMTPTHATMMYLIMAGLTNIFAAAPSTKCQPNKLLIFALSFKNADNSQRFAKRSTYKK